RLAESDRLRDVAVEAPPAGTAVMVRADEVKIRQVIVNVVVNAIEAATARVRIRAEAQAGGGLLVGSDDGPGMTAEARAHVFEPFFTTKRSGTGMGLAIAQTIVDAHAGRIEVASQPGEGASVSLWLPAPTENP